MSKFTYIPTLGFVEVSAKGEFAPTSVKGVFDEGAVDTEIAREFGLSREMKQSDALAEALKNPEAWLTKRNEAIKGIMVAVNNVYVSETGKMIYKGYSNDEAIAYAKKVAQNEKDRLWKQLEIDFPTHLENIVVSKLKHK